MLKRLGYLALAFAGLVFAIGYYTLFGPILGVAFAATAWAAAFACVVGLERLRYSEREHRIRRTTQLFFGFLFLIAFFEPMDRCLDRGGAWDWYSAACDH